MGTGLESLVIRTHTMKTRWTGSAARLGLMAVLGLALSMTPATLAQQAETPEPQTTPAAGSELPASAQSPTDTIDQRATESTQEDKKPEAAPTATVPAPPKDPKSYGLWTLLPAVVAILLAIFTRQVVPALVIGVLCGAYMMVPCLAADNPLAQQNTIVGGFRLAMETYVLGAIHETPDKNFAHLKIIVFTLVIGFTVGVIGRNGGTAGMVKLVAGESESPRRGALTAWFAGLVVFFDDYANTMIVGPTMRSVFDRVKLSRAKLAYIVDSTAAPVASIALIGTWVGAEMGYIQTGIDSVVASGTPGFLVDANGQVSTGMGVFVQSLAYRFYPILALVLVFFVALTGRDFGPMKRSERKMHEPSSASVAGIDIQDVTPGTASPVWWLGLLPIIVLVLGTIGVLAATGYAAPGTVSAMQAVGADGASLWEQNDWWINAGRVLENSNSTLSIFYGAILSAVAAIVLTLVAGACPFRDVVDAGIEGMTRMFPAIVILVLAWAISGVLTDLQLGKIVASHLQAAEFPIRWLPLAVFLCAALISFATGTSWGTMGILCPVTVEISARLMGDVEVAEASSLFYASVGSVLAGAVFGDHCSPISDTTVLSSIAAGCRHEEHVWTQIPYALVAAAAAMGLGDYMCSVKGQPWYLGLAAGSLFLLVFIFVVGRRCAPRVVSSPIRPHIA